MRWFAIIMAIVMAVLVVLPCTDGDNSCADDKLAISAPSQHDHDQDFDDLCSPFCSCACCSVVMYNLYFTAQNLTILTAVDAPQNLWRNVFVASHNLGSVWQPPKSNV